MEHHLHAPPAGFGAGLSWITGPSDPDGSGIALGVLRLAGAGEWTQAMPAETAFLLMSGELRARVGSVELHLCRGSLFDDLPSVVHAPAGATVSLECAGAAELTVYRTGNERHFPAAIVGPSAVRSEARGRGQVRDGALRIVRTILDNGSTDPAAHLVLGEVVTLPGRWSSYPPHHHPQPEIYHYRFDDPRGYGHAELGETVLKVRHGDTVKIAGGLDHAQCAAPGYAMYYSWVIRHLPDGRYVEPETSEEHAWVMEPGSSCWWPEGVLR
ncbi:MAG: 5-deoxy-glucuronate isomerase [Deltaproteobacteria bacterium]|nr:5-deoxy-glucuronate isomerase [Deltaproteobacteria bacterium]